MDAKIISKADLSKWMDGSLKEYRLIGVKEKEGGKFEFAPLSSSSELRLDYDVTVLPPKKYLQPPRENLLQFSRGGNAKAEINSEPMIIIGVHPYDMRAINQMDKVFSEDNKDMHYLERRSKIMIIGCDPLRASKWSFWQEMNNAAPLKNFDLWLTDLGDRYFVEIGSNTGKKLLKSADCAKASKHDIECRTNARMACATEKKININIKELPALFKTNYDHKIWEEKAKKCYSCGSCNLVCPTCYCFDVRDEMELDLVNGRRVRVWDGCLLEEFAKVGSGENFREERSERFRHRLFRKMVYMNDKVGEIACVGCGRCASVCLPDIADPVKVINELKG